LKLFSSILFQPHTSSLCLDALLLAPPSLYADKNGTNLLQAPPVLLADKHGTNLLSGVEL